MKTITRLFAIAVIALGAHSSKASNPNPSVTIRALDQASFAVYLKDIEKTKVKIQILDRNGSVLLTSMVRNKRQFARKFNMGNLSEGAYKLKITDEQKTQVYPILIENKVLSVNYEDILTSYKPVVKYVNKSVNLMVFSPAKEKHTLKIYNNENVVLHDEIIEEEVNIQKRLDFTAANKGTYRIVISNQENAYTYLMAVN